MEITYICYMSKIQSINSDMTEIHDLNNNLYEHLVDNEGKQVEEICDTLIGKYKDIKTSIQSNKI